VSVRDIFTQYESVLRPALRLGPILGGAAVLAWRVRETRVPITTKSIVVPPLAMSTGFCMFLSPLTRVPWSWAFVALCLGFFVLSWPLLRSSRLELRETRVYMKRSRSFLWVLFGLFSVRLLLHDYVGHLISPLQTASVFYLLAFGMIVRWRASLWFSYRRIVAVDVR
jgi:membrane protein CcdC involved in cytochrome C biogenesis